MPLLFFRRPGLVISIVLVAAALTAVAACQKTKPVKIGYLGGLSGRSSGLGQEGRDAFLLAVDDWNRRGGLNGVSIEPVVMDRGEDRTTAAAALQGLKAAGVIGVVGPMVSQAAIEMVPEANRQQLVLVAPTVSTDALSGLDDYFIRPHYTDTQVVTSQAAHFSDKGHLRLVMFYDLANKSYAESWLRSLASSYDGQVKLIPFDGKSDSFTELVGRVDWQPDDAVLVLAGAPDTAMLCQQLTKQKVKAALYATCWSVSGPLVSLGGASVEGMEFLHSINVRSEAPAYVAFERDFKARYSRDPFFPAMHAYDATNLLLQAAAERRPDEGVREAILRIRRFEGIQYPLVFDAYGDLDDPPLFLTKVVDARLAFVCVIPEI